MTARWPRKTVARPIHPPGRAALVGLSLPLPAPAGGALAAHLAGRVAGAAVALVLAAIREVAAALPPGRSPKTRRGCPTGGDSATVRSAL